MEDMMDKRYFAILPYEEVKDLSNLRLSSVEVVPQRERGPRPIVDYSFYQINQETIQKAPPEPMQFGRALERILYAIHTASEKHGPVYMLKLDISDGFCRIPLRAEDIPTLGVVLPRRPGERQLIAFPLVLPMGWTESPPIFCTATETAVDLVNQYFGHWDPPPHPLEKVASTPPSVSEQRRILTGAAPKWTEPMIRAEVELPMLPPNQRRKGKLQYADVYVDDEIVVAQGSNARLNRRVLFHINDLVFRPNDDEDEGRREPISIKKLKQGDACWATYHTVLGWTIDTLKGILELPAHRKERLMSILNSVVDRKRCTEKDMHKLLGELRSMGMAIPGCRGLFSHLQSALTRRNGHRVKLHQGARDHAMDFRILANDLALRPTRVGDVVPAHPSFKGTVDAAKSGMGGVWLPKELDPTHPPIVWRHPFPKLVQRRVVTEHNPKGDVTNSDLELAGTIAHEDIIAQESNAGECTLVVGCDNIAAVSWRTKGSTITQGAAAYLLREAGLQEWRERYRSERFYVPGPANHLADIATRRFDLTDLQLLTYLNTHAPQ